MNTFRYENTEIKIYGGYNNIGGNCIVIKSPSRTIMLDQGVNFSQLRKFYGFYILPDSVEELREMSVLPRREAYKDVEEIYVSHFHLDHLGSLNTPIDVPIYLPSREIIEILPRSWFFGWKQQLLPETLSLYDFRNIEEGRIRYARVSHSAFPSYAFRIDTDDVSILYTGDFRISSPIKLFNDPLEEFENLSEDGVDVLIIEGTNFGRRMSYMTSEGFNHLLNDLLIHYDRKIFFISTHPLDLESLLATFEIIQRNNFNIVFTSNYYAQLVDKMMNYIKFVSEKRIILCTATTTKFRHLDDFEIEFSLTSLKDRKLAIFVPATDIKEIAKISKLMNEDSRGLIHIAIIGELVNEEWIIERRKIENWLNLLGITNYKIHLSGHYHPFEFKKILAVIRPKNIIPIHTVASRTMKELFEKYKFWLDN